MDGELPGLTVQDRAQPDMGAVKPVYVDEAAKLAEYKPLAKVEELEEVNLNQIDNVLSNTVPKAEEKKEARQVEQERLEELQCIEEEERKRRARGERPSLRVRLAAKKAIVAANSAAPQREIQRQVQNEAITSERGL